jgi:hypothetical protein
LFHSALPGSASFRKGEVGIRPPKYSGELPVQRTIFLLLRLVLPLFTGGEPLKYSWLVDTKQRVELCSITICVCKSFLGVSTFWELEGSTATSALFEWLAKAQVIVVRKPVWKEVRSLNLATG